MNIILAKNKADNCLFWIKVIIVITLIGFSFLVAYSIATAIVNHPVVNAIRNLPF